MLFFFVFSSLIGCLLSATVYDSWTTGRSTLYDGVDGGACSYGTIETSSFPYGYIAAPNEAFWDSANACGQCYQVQCLGDYDGGTEGCCNTDSNGDNKIVTIKITDYCPTSGNGEHCSGDMTHFDLSTTAFDYIAETSCGVISMQYRRVSCDYSDNIIIRNKDGVNAWWLAIFVEDINGYGDLSKVELKDSSSDNYVEGSFMIYNAYLFTSSTGFQTPMTVRLTSSNGDVITGTDVITDTNGNSEFDFGSNFGTSSTGVTSSPDDLDPTPKPTDPVSSPTPKPTTPSPVAISGGSDDVILLTNYDGVNQWWFAFTVSDIESGYSVSKVEIRDSSSGATWIEGSSFWGAFLFTSSSGFESPLDVRITSTNGDVLTSYDVITSFTPYDEFKFGSNFDGSAAFTIDDGSSDSSGNNNNNNTVLIVVIIGAIVILLIIGIVACTCYIKRRNKKEKERVEAQVSHYTAVEL